MFELRNKLSNMEHTDLFLLIPVRFKAKLMLT